MIKNIIFIFMLILLTLSSVAIGYLAKSDIESLIRDIRQKDIQTPDECRNLTMKDAAYCLNDYVKGIFKYKERPDKETPSLEELKEEGGDCLNWAELYVEIAEDLGFYVDVPVIDTGNKTAHAFAVISDETGYCVLEQKSVKCFNFGKLQLESEN